MPSASTGAKDLYKAGWGEVTLSFARRWPPSDPIAQLTNPFELPVDDAVLLYGNWEQDGLRVCLLYADTGRVKSQRLRCPARRGAAFRSFEERGIGALAIDLRANLVCCCGAAPGSFLPPPVVLWDLETGLVIAEHDFGNFGFPSSVIDRVPGRRFTVGTRVACNVDAGWVPGVIVRCNYREPDWPPGEVAPYQIRCMDGTLVFAPSDSPQLVRRDVGEGVYAEDFEVQAAICVNTRQVLIGFFSNELKQPVSHLHLANFGW